MSNKYITFFVSTEKHDRIIRHLNREVRKCKSSIFFLGVVVGALVGVVADQRMRINELEKRIVGLTVDKIFDDLHGNKDETAG